MRGAGGDAFVTIDFEQAGRKSIMLNYAKLEKLDRANASLNG